MRHSVKKHKRERYAIIISILLYVSIISMVLFQSPVEVPRKIDKDILGSQDVLVDGTVGIYVSPPTPTSTPLASPQPTAEAGTPTPTPVSTPTPSPLAIFGYGPPNSSVKIQAYGIDLKSISDNTGYFKFTDLPFPNIYSYPLGYFYPELCLSALGDKEIASNPVCIPPLPNSSHETSVGPIILAPTLVLSQGTAPEGSQLTASGETVPESVVEIHLAKGSATSKLNIVTSISAEGLSISTVKADASGKYQFAIPTNEVNDWRIFTSANYGGSGSPKSNTLTYYIKPISYRLVEIYQDALFKIKPYILSAIIGAEILILTVLITISQKKPKKATVQKKV